MEKRASTLEGHPAPLLTVTKQGTNIFAILASSVRTGIKAVQSIGKKVIKSIFLVLAIILANLLLCCQK